MGRNKGSAECEKHPYMRVAFWQKPENHFWESGFYSDKTKDKYREWLSILIKSQKNVAVL